MTSAGRFRDTVVFRSLALFTAIPIIVSFPQVFGQTQFDTAIIGAVVLALTATEKSHLRETLLDIACWLPVSFLLCALTLMGLVHLTPHTIDHYIDIGVSRHFMAWARVHPAGDLFFRFIYATILLAVAVGSAASSNPWRVVKTLLIASLLAIPIFVLFPATGPAWISDPTAPRNCIPSLHVTWAILLAWQSERKWKWLFVPYAVFTAISTMTTGEHYLLDIVLAAPFSVLVMWLASSPKADDALIYSVP
jgi:hypothetical protein